MDRRNFLQFLAFSLPATALAKEDPRTTYALVWERDGVQIGSIEVSEEVFFASLRD